MGGSLQSVLRVYWPRHKKEDAKDAKGWLVGWKNSDYDYFVVSVMPDTSLAYLETALQDGTFPFRYSSLFTQDVCNGNVLAILGMLNLPAATTQITSNDRFVVATTKPNFPLPRLSVSWSPDIDVQLILFDPPEARRMQYVSFEPMALSIPGVPGVPVKSQQPGPLYGKLESHRSSKSNIHHEGAAIFAIITQQVNSTNELAALLQFDARKIVPRRRKRAVSVSDRVREQALALQKSLRLRVLGFLAQLWKIASPMLYWFFIDLIMILRLCAEVILTVFEFRIFSDWYSLNDCVTSAQQISQRLQQCCYWPLQQITLLRRRQDWASITVSHPDYIRFYNSLWLVLNDMIMGAAFGSYLIENNELVASIIAYAAEEYSINGLHRLIIWLKGWPAGLKLNSELADFMGDIFIWLLVNFWSFCISILKPHLPLAVLLIGYAGLAGGSLSISLLSDLLSLLTFQITCFHIASARIFNWQLNALISLFHLFRGKKRNVLRHRIDSCDYDLDQLLLGTILFTLLTFLFPTVAVFYFSFASCRIGVIALKVFLDGVLACLNNFPLFALMLRMKDPRRLPGGIRFKLLSIPAKRRSSSFSGTSDNQKQRTPNPTSYLVLEPIPLHFALILSEYGRIYQRLRAHYITLSVLLGFATGGVIPYLQYSQLALGRTSVKDFWLILRGQMESPTV